MTSAEIRERFLKFFESHQHKRIASASLIPAEDPTLYFTNAGMVPFKDYFTGVRTPSVRRATSSQRCMRVSGKHNDLENVGRTPRHHTFFEMLGNFSFGDYFKRDAIAFAWEFLTGEVQIPRERLWITIFRDDDEAGKLWQEVAAVSSDRILRLGEKDNFWSMGETGPCGPCSEIHYDRGASFGCGKPGCSVECDCGRYMEIWNLVFMQFERDASGKMTPLPKPSIDTGMGLERLAAVLQGVSSNYDTDLFMPIIQEVAKLTGKKYGQTNEADVSMRVLADHIRATVFLITDGILPSNEGRGYVLRRIMRRAIRHGRLLGKTESFFYRLAAVVVKEMGAVYPEVVREAATVTRVIRSEEEKFLETLEKGLGLIGEAIDAVKQQGQNILPGSVVFKLYDTFGFPVDLTEVIASEQTLTLDMVGFDAAMEAQKTRGRKAWKGSGKRDGGYRQLVGDEVICEFAGYEQLEVKAPIVALVQGGKRVERIVAGKVGVQNFEPLLVMTAKTSFYPEGGGQVGDRGRLEGTSSRALVEDTQKGGEGLIVHRTKLVEGRLQEGDEVSLLVDPEYRAGSMAHHSVTHLMHAALRNTLGKHVRQAGSLVESNRLRFDFNHFESVTPEQLRRIEDEVNQQVFGNLAVTKQSMAYDEAIQSGALAFFEEKYGDKVRVVKMGDYSVELCGGTHVRTTGEIGLFKITGESSVAAGVRRIEAIAGQEALRRLQELEGQMAQLATSLKVAPAQVLERIEKLLAQIKDLEKSLDRAKRQQSSGGDTEELREIQGVKVLTSLSSVGDGKLLREVSDRLIQKLGSGIVAVGTVEGDKVSIIVRVSPDLTTKFKAGELIKPLAEKVGGKGGGRPDMAQAGGANTAALQETLQSIYQNITLQG